MAGIVFDPTITLGGIIGLLGTGAAGLAIYYGLKSDIRMLLFRMEAVEKVTMHISVVMTQMAVQNNRLDQQAERMNRLDNRLDGFSKGEGFVIQKD